MKFDIFNKFKNSLRRFSLQCHLDNGNGHRRKNQITEKAELIQFPAVTGRQNIKSPGISFPEPLCSYRLISFILTLGEQ